MDINELVQRALRKENTDEEWLQLEKDMIQFLKESHNQSEKRKLRFGWAESVAIICDGIRRKRGKE